MTALALAAALAAAQWSAVVTIKDLAHPRAQVELSLPGVTGEASICFGRSRSAPFASGLPRDPNDSDCLRAAAGPGGELHARYDFDLDGLCQSSHDPDDCSRGPGGMAFTDKALLALPMKGRAALEVRFDLPDGADVAAPFEALPGQHRFRTTAGQIRAGTYLALGKLHRLPDLSVDGGAFELVAFDLPRRSTDQGLQEWLRNPARAAARFWRGLPGGRALLILAPVPGSDRGGIFGSVLHEGLPSAVLYFGADAADADLRGGWVAFHELFHTGQPTMSRRTAWFIEGTATYYQDVLRARAGERTPVEMWSDLGESLLEHCAPQDGMSLSEESRELRRTHNYPHVYWMGACTAFRLDVRMRELSKGKWTLDDSMRALAEAGRDRELDEAYVLETLDAKSNGLATELIKMTKDPRTVSEELMRLGVEMKGDKASLHDDAPSAELRRAIF